MKIARFLALAAVALPAILVAQQPTAPSPNPITAAFKASGTNYGRWIMMAFDSVPESKYSFKPMPVQQSIGFIAQHLETANYTLCAPFGGMTRPMMTSRDSLADTVKAMWPKDTLVARLKASFAFCDNAMATVDDAKIGEMMSLPGPNNTTRMVPRARYVLGYVTDLVDHYSQMANYMRGMGMVPPSARPRPGPGRGGEE